MSKRKLTNKQEQFCQEYLIDLNGTQAAIRAGYSERTARQIADQNLSKLDIQLRLRELQEKRQQRVQLDQDYVLKTIIETIERCKQGEPVMIKDGDQWVESGEWKFDSQAVLKGAELLGKHLALWTEKMKIDAEVKGSISPDRWLKLTEDK